MVWNTAGGRHRRHGVGVNQRDAVPQEPCDKKRPLADCERRLGADADEARLELLQPVSVIAPERGHGGPALSVVADVLALVETDGTLGGQLRGGRSWRLAGDADERVHAAQEK